jgi:hypothetical protein
MNNKHTSKKKKNTTRRPRFIQDFNREGVNPGVRDYKIGFHSNDTLEIVQTTRLLLSVSRHLRSIPQIEPHSSM